MTAQEILTEANLQDTHWGKVIIEAEAGHGFSVKEQRDAGNWCTCACGRTTCDIPRHVSPPGEGDTWPLDKTLYALGMDFYDFVCSNAYEDSAKTLVEIEKRAQIVATQYQLEKGLK